ncbi:MAG: 1-deoxy-D-xylulose-5-phosphate reductoisomerase [Chloroflexota bacterium]|nr:1-deoxy-D-xylulose-5-phosphate reductoisomerase [Lentimicrobium sp.]
MKRRIAILGSTGSIGSQALEVIDSHPDLFEITLLAANINSDLLIRQAIKYKPDTVVITNADQYDIVKSALDPIDIKVYTGSESLCQMMESDIFDIVLVALVGYAGLKPTYAAINAGKPVALANKEVLVVAGHIITQLAAVKSVPVIPVDSEHSAIFQCLAGEVSSPEKIYLTASGGPFRGMSHTEMGKVTIAQALHHPKWSMGNKVTIDSATMMNKGLEMIEAKWLFSLEPGQIDILVHPQSIIHSMVQFTDGTLKAQLGLADMRLPIQYALSYPYRLNADFGRIDFNKVNSLTFESPDRIAFPCIDLAYKAINEGGNMPCIMNAANEIAVASFLCGKIIFNAIPEIISECMEAAAFIKEPDLDALLETNYAVRAKASEICKSAHSKP